MKHTVRILMAAALLMIATAAFSQPLATDQGLLQQMQETIRQQQQQLQQQADQIKTQVEVLQKLKQQVDSLQGSLTAPHAPVPAAVAVAQPQPPAVITSGNDKIKLSLSGQVNRAVNVINDGGRTKVYHVDNDADNSQLSFVGTAKVTNDLTLGTRLEFAMTADESSAVSQNAQSPGNFIDAKWAEVSLLSERFGKLSLGKGATASDGTATVDLSKTDIILYSSISDIAGGILFRQKDGSYSGTTLAQSFNALNGLGKKSRLRYDTPALLGFTLSSSLNTGQSSDVAVNWGGEGYGFQAAGGFGLANPKLEGSALQYDGSFSLLHKSTGLNLTTAGGLQERRNAKDGTNLYAKLGWLADLTKAGYTAFGVDYTRTRDMAAEGDKGYSVGGAVVQAFEKYATEFYLQYRLFSLDRTAGISVSDISVGTFGVRVKF